MASLSIHTMPGGGTWCFATYRRAGDAEQALRSSLAVHDCTLRVRRVDYERVHHNRKLEARLQPSLCPLCLGNALVRCVRRTAAAGLVNGTACLAGAVECARRRARDAHPNGACDAGWRAQDVQLLRGPSRAPCGCSAVQSAGGAGRGTYTRVARCETAFSRHPRVVRCDQAGYHGHPGAHKSHVRGRHGRIVGSHCFPVCAARPSEHITP